MTRIFISHSHSDQAIAFRLVNFLLAALRVEEEDIFCSSDPDQGLAYNSNSITDQLKIKLKNSEAIILLITLDSLHSAWIPFEAGSFWTTDKTVIPILGIGLTQNDLPGPLKSFLSIAIDTPDFADKLNSATNQLSDKLAITQKFTTRRNHTLKEFSQHLKDWQPKYSNNNSSQQQQIEELNKQLEEFKTTFQQEKEQIEQSYEDKIQELQQSYQEQQQLEQSLRSQIQQLEEELKQQETSSRDRIDSIAQTDSSAITKMTSEAALGFLDFQDNDIDQAIKNNEVELTSAKGVNYSKLRNLLEQQQWQEADKETYKVMLQTINRDLKDTYLRVKDIEHFPCEDLLTINQLWLQYSDAKFGFSVQEEIYKSLGGTEQYNDSIWNSLADRIGWRINGRWLRETEIIYDHYVTPKGHLPAMWLWHVWSDYSYGSSRGELILRKLRIIEDKFYLSASLAQRFKICNP